MKMIFFNSSETPNLILIDQKLKVELLLFSRVNRQITSKLLKQEQVTSKIFLVFLLISFCLRWQAPKYSDWRWANI